MFKKVFITFCFIATAALVWWGFDRLNWADPLETLIEVGDIINPIQIEERIVAPPPLSLDDHLDRSVENLDLDNIWKLGNQMRKIEGQAPLARSNLLDQAAQLKAEDMFQRQYFAHESPDGQDISWLVGAVGYDFILVGENLALGNFQNEEELIDGWMNSPGHRQNILNQRYQEIGIAAKRGEFEGRVVWLAVQVFGLSTSACPVPDQEIRELIDRNKEALEQKYLDIEMIREELNQVRPRRGEDYADLVDAYNLLVRDYNELTQETADTIEEYNRQVTEFNHCLGY